ncbi:TonB-dependent receptor [Cereibacter sphaeroides]|uniref:TonB-dependent receptor n=1 Tax=Cereibacter sphaeroides TaxID=1063 RepID=UPI000E5BE64C|nr:TonB-dependent receptor [Cereibacter sphaeroides]RIA00531.1 TonB-dependent receptor [Cereibacter sphaeroides]
MPHPWKVLWPALPEHQAVLTISEALPDVSGVQGTIPHQTPALEAILLRGFPVEVYREDTTSDINITDANAMAGVERTEVAKGLNDHRGATGTPLGGLVNIVTEMPLPAHVTEIGLTYGTTGCAEPSCDINRQVSGSVLVAAVDDALLPDDSLRIAAAWRQAGVPAGRHVSADGAHGFRLTPRGEASPLVRGPRRVGGDAWAHRSRTPPLRSSGSWREPATSKTLSGSLARPADTALPCGRSRGAAA